ncbi:MAG: hypothetical protein P8186_19380, partial [Anaerolineae bacterium]
MTHPTQPSAHSRARLTRWGLILLWTALLTAVAVLVIGLEISRRYAYALAHPGCSGPHRTPTEVGISDYREVTFAPGKSAPTNPRGMGLAAWWLPSKNGAAV